MERTPTIQATAEGRAKSGPERFSASHGYAPYASNRESEGVGGVRKFEAEGVTLLCGDCRDLLPIKADAVVSDPPYGMEWDGRITRGPNGTGKEGATRSYGKTIMHDAEEYDPSPWLEYPIVVLWGWLHYAQRLPKGSALVWLKRYDAGFGSFLSDADIAWMKGGLWNLRQA